MTLFSPFISGNLEFRIFLIVVLGVPVIGAISHPAMGQGCDATELSKLIASDASINDEFGISVSVSGNTAVIGAYLDTTPGGISSGTAYVFARIGEVWTQQAILFASDAAPRDHFGFSVSISGNTVLVGAPEDDHSGMSDAGSAYIFVQDEGVWTQRAKLVAAVPSSDDHFGVSVAVSGDYAIIGAFADDHVNGNPTNEGSAYVYSKPALGWANMTETARLSASDAHPDNQFGISVAFSGNTAVVGANWNSHSNQSRAGAVYVFEKPTSGWVTKTETAKLTASDAATNDEFGIAVAVSNSTVIVGAYLDDNAAGDVAGAAYLFSKPPCGWTNATESTKLMTAHASPGDNFGISVAMEDETVVVGAHYANSQEINNTGAAYVFTRIGSEWAEQGRLTASDGGSADRFGYAVAVSNGCAIVGAYDDHHGGGAYAGSAYVFRAASCDSDGDGVPDAFDLCPNSASGLPVDSAGRPLRDCNKDCVFNALDIQCIVDELLSH